MFGKMLMREARCRTFPKHWETRAFNIEESSGTVYLPAARHRFRISFNNFTFHFLMWNLKKPQTPIDQTPTICCFFSVSKALCFYSTYVTDLPQQTHFHVDASSLNKWCLFFMPLWAHNQHSRSPFLCNFGCWRVLHKVKPSHPRHQSNILWSAIDVHATLRCLPPICGCRCHTLF